MSAPSRAWVRRSAKAVAEASLLRSGLPRIARSRRRGEVLVLAYHNVVPAGERAVGDLSLHLPQRAFARQLDRLAATHDVVPLAGIFDPPSGRRPRAVVTFDDAYLGAVTAGVEELARRGLPATVFVAPAFLGGGTFWWDEIADPAAGAVEEAARRHCLEALQGSTPAVLEWARARGTARNPLPAHQRAASEEDLARAVARPGITLGSHTWSHRNLAALEPAALREELERPLAWLRERFPAALPWITYPYGLTSPRVEEAAERAGYEAALRVEGGWYAGGPAAGARFSLPRMNVPSGLSLRGFELRAAGVLGRS